MQTQPTQPLQTTPTYQHLHQQLPTKAQQLLTILNPDTTPHNYTQQYGHTTPKNTHLAKYLNTTTKEIKKLKTIIKHHALIQQLGQ